MSYAPAPPSHALHIAHTWDGVPIAPAERARVGIVVLADHLQLRVDAPFHGDPPPPGPPGPTDALWEHEVVEVLFLGPDARYTEVELGPHGHHLVLQLHGCRQVVASRQPLHNHAQVRERRWTGIAHLDRAFLPPGPLLVNAYAIHGVGAARRYLAMTPVPGPHPDFHRLDAFVYAL